MRNALVVSQSPDTLAQKWPQLFDAILVDAPCSGEGMFRRHPETRLEWDDASPARCAVRQSLILESAARMLKVGGRLCYSTCTFSAEENEGAIRAFMSSHPEFAPVDFTVAIGNGQTLRSQNGCIRFYPHTVRSEGHFAALLQKTDIRAEEERPAALLPAKTVFATPDRQSREAFQAFWAEGSPLRTAGCERYDRKPAHRFAAVAPTDRAESLPRGGSRWDGSKARDSCPTMPWRLPRRRFPCVPSRWNPSRLRLTCTAKCCRLAIFQPVSLQYPVLVCRLGL